MRISDWSSDVCSSDLVMAPGEIAVYGPEAVAVGAAVIGRQFSADQQHLRTGITADADHGIEVCRQFGRRQTAQAIVAAQFDQYQIGRASCRERGCQYV